MKKAKIMLSAIAVIAVIGGAVAFKAKSFTNPNVFYRNTINGHCNAPVNLKTVPVGTPLSFTTSGDYTTLAIDATCPLTTITVISDL